MIMWLCDYVAVCVAVCVQEYAHPCLFVAGSCHTIHESHCMLPYTNLTACLFPHHIIHKSDRHAPCSCMALSTNQEHGACRCDSCTADSLG